MSSKFRWNDGLYDEFFRVCLPMTNFRINKKPLRADDLVVYKRIKNLQYVVGEETVAKRKRVQKSIAKAISRRKMSIFGVS